MNIKIVGTILLLLSVLWLIGPIVLFQEMIFHVLLRANYFFDLVMYGWVGAIGCLGYAFYLRKTFNNRSVYKWILVLNGITLVIYVSLFTLMMISLFGK